MQNEINGHPVTTADIRKEIQRERQLPASILQQLANEPLNAQRGGYNPFMPACTPGTDEQISIEETHHGQWSFFICQRHTVLCHLSPAYSSEMEAVYAEAKINKNKYDVSAAFPQRMLIPMDRQFNGDRVPDEQLTQQPQQHEQVTK